MCIRDSDDPVAGLASSVASVTGRRIRRPPLGQERTYKRRPIGVFDSGVGGLTVVRALRAVLPGEDVVYLGDTARLPYGSKSSRTVERYSLTCQQFLLDSAVAEAVLQAIST